MVSKEISSKNFLSLCNVIFGWMEERAEIPTKGKLIAGLARYPRTLWAQKCICMYDVRVTESIFM